MASLYGDVYKQYILLVTHSYFCRISADAVCPQRNNYLEVTVFWYIRFRYKNGFARNGSNIFTYIYG